MTDLNPYQAPANVGTDATHAAPWISEELKRVRVGLLVIYYAIGVVLFSMIGGPILMLVTVAAGLGSMGAAAALCAALGVLVGIVAIMIGQVMCVSVPAESNAKGMVIGSVLCQGLSVLYMIGSVMLPVIWPGARSGPPTVLMGFIGLASLGTKISGLVSLFSFLVFVKRLNVYIGNQPQARTARTVIGLLTGLVAASLFFYALNWASSVGGWTVKNLVIESDVVVGVGFLVILVLGLVTFVKYANLVLYTAKAIGGLGAPLSGNQA